MDIIEIMPTERVVRYLSSRLRGCARKPGVLKGPHHADEVASAARGSSGGRSGRASRSLARLRPSHWHSQSARAHVHATPPLERAHAGTRASFGTTRSTARHPPAPPTIAPRCIMASMPATTLATADKMTQRSTIGASSRSSPQPRAPRASSGMPNVVDRGVAAGSTSRWRASRAAGGQ